MFSLNEVIQSLTDQQISLNRRVFSEAVVDSRQSIHGSLFIAIPGEKADGHQFITAAFANGASAAVVEKETDNTYTCIDLRKGKFHVSDLEDITDAPFCIRVENTVDALQKIASFHRDLLNFQVIGITGTVGKTTTKELVNEVLSQRYHTLKNIGNMNNEIGLPLTILRAGKGIERAVLEMGFYVPGEIDLLCQISKPKIGVLTNVGTVHAERAGSLEVIARGKSELVRNLPAEGTAILNYDDPYVRPMAEVTKANVFYYGLNPKANLWADEIESFGLEGINFCLHYKKEKHYLRIPLIGRHSVHTALRAAAVGKVEGLSWPEIFRGLNYGQSQLRMSVIHSEEGALIIDDTYNASPDSTMAALNLLHEMDGKKIAILGEMRELGQYEKQGHEMVGMRAAEICDELIAVGPVTKIMADAAQNNDMPKKNIHWLETVPEAISYLQKRGLRPDEVVLIKGSRGMQMERIVESLEAKA